MPLPAGSASNSFLTASSPPAEAPIPTTGKSRSPDDEARVGDCCRLSSGGACLRCRPVLVVVPDLSAVVCAPVKTLASQLGRETYVTAIAPFGPFGRRAQTSRGTHNVAAIGKSRRRDLADVGAVVHDQDISEPIHRRSNSPNFQRLRKLHTLAYVKLHNIFVQ